MPSISFEVSTTSPIEKRILADDSSMLTSASLSSISRCTSVTVLRGTMMPGMPAAPAGTGRSVCASRWPSVATARSVCDLPEPATCR